MKDRFEVIYKEAHSAGLEKRVIYVDKETGVNYLYIQNGYSGGLTPLLDAGRKPLIYNAKSLESKSFPAFIALFRFKGFP